jgi:hypothetical protein
MVVDCLARDEENWIRVRLHPVHARWLAYGNSL